MSYIRTPEIRAKQSAARKGKPLSLETLERMRRAKLGKKLSQETKDKMRATMLTKWATGSYGKRLKGPPIPPHLHRYALKLRYHGIKGQEFRKAIEMATEANPHGNLMVSG